MVESRIWSSAVAECVLQAVASGGGAPSCNPRVAAAVATFLRAHLDPLFQAKVIDKATFKAAMQVGSLTQKSSSPP